MVRSTCLVLAALGVVAATTPASSAEDSKVPSPLTTVPRWDLGGPFLSADPTTEEEWLSVKDPTIVRFEGQWHLFRTVRGRKRSHAIEYSSFVELSGADDAPRTILPMHEGFFCAPQVFYFTPHQKWYLLFQAADEAWEPNYQPACSTTRDISDPKSWSRAVPLFGRKPEAVQAWLDFWVICDDAKAHLFFTSLDGKMWRAETPLGKFPHGWSDPEVALRGDVFEASHTYRLKGQDAYLTVIEAQGGHGWRYQKTYLADRLDGAWRPLLAERDPAFASLRNVTQSAERWTDCVSHGELLRAGHDEKLEVDPEKLRFLFQGVLDRDRAGKPYGAIPWRLGVLERSTEARGAASSPR